MAIAWNAHRKSRDLDHYLDADYPLAQADAGLQGTSMETTSSSCPTGGREKAPYNLLTDCNCREPIMGYPQWKGFLCSIRKADTL
jgi:hypothetical protein